MTTLKEILCMAGNRPKVIEDAARLIASEVDSKGGIAGIALKTGYKAVQKVKPGLINDAVDSLLDRFVERLEPFFADWNAQGRSPGFDQFLAARKTAVANALLGVTDDRVKVATNNVIKKAYQTLRPQGEKNVEAAVPGLGKLVARYV